MYTAEDYPLDDFDDDDLLTDWEANFMASVGCQDYELTEAQQSKLAEIEEALEERRELARQGKWQFRR